MNNNIQPPHTSFADDDAERFLVRWRGRNEGPYSPSIIEQKLASNQIGMLHEVLHNGQWITLREYLAERHAVAQAKQKAREEAERWAVAKAEQKQEEEREQKQEEERQERRSAIAEAEQRRDEAQHRTETLAQQRGGSAVLGSNYDQQQFNNSFRQARPMGQVAGRGGTILTFGIIGFLVCAPFGIAAWVMGNTDIRMMNAGFMDEGDRSMTQAGRVLGIVTTSIYIAAIAIGIFVLIREK